MSSAYLRLLIFLPAILIPACASSSHKAWQNMDRSNEVQDGGIFNFQWSLSLLLHSLYYISKLNDTPTSALAVLRLTIKCQKLAIAQFLEISTSSLTIIGIILSLISPWNSPAWKKLTMPYFRVLSLDLWDGLHSVCGVCFSLNKSSSCLNPLLAIS